MKKRLLVLILAALVLQLCWWRLRVPTTEPTIATHPHQSAPSAPVAAGATTGAKPDTHAAAERTSEQAQATARVTATRQRGESSNQPIRFYGKVIDQHDQPIPGVKVTLGVRNFKEPMPGVMGDDFDYPVVTTGDDGRFSLTDAKGSLLTIKSLEKLGYEASTKTVNKSYWYWRDPSMVFHPNVDAPEIFRMWKQQGAETLVRKGISTQLRYDGTPTAIDLITGRAASQGDIRVMLIRNPQKIVYGQRNYEWTLTVEAVDGGLLESKEEQMFLAPEEGYQSKIVIHMPADAAEWTDVKSFNLYVRLRGGKQYGRAELKALVGAPRETTPLYITSFVNPTGSRNLEYDPAQDVNGEPTARMPKP